ncbi:hypothetical protein NEA10_00925 [Phormidium yuhuli AB48]|uniref:Uncharacterized protein n=1 Tax=Phormidium yuhuli AB48 TaxID=2940671 RepID=A0ABY5AQ45_9CYAN|nr:hypothetical protein [Phormidium yuhuli]USR91337.1 hypothetical protein NEA10_00925 [Phormidium yuhuli AB48]
MLQKLQRHWLKLRPLAIALAALLLLLGVSHVRLQSFPVRHNSPEMAESLNSSDNEDHSEEDIGLEFFNRGTDRAVRAWQASQQASTPEDWHQVVQYWTEALAAMQSVPVTAPQRAFAQKKVQEYLENADFALQQAGNSGNRLPHPTFNSLVLDEQFALYRSYVATLGPPDILIIGSSRGLQGLDGKRLQFDLNRRGFSGVRVFNFGINGATAQVVNLQLRELLTRDQLPNVMVWADGSRAFNSGREDRTFSRIRNSPGYERLRNSGVRQGGLPVILSRRDIDSNGFQIVRDRFNPQTYFQQFPRVPGQYDGDYANFNLGGVQGNATNRVIEFCQSRNIPLILVNLPLTNEYLDPARRRYERQFQEFLQQQGQKSGVWVRDLSNQWRDRPDFFADPSHLNREGAAAVAQRLAQDTELPWDSFLRG